MMADKLTLKSSAALLTVGMVAVIGSALAFQYIGGYIPCHLCLIQRQPYYFGIPLGVLAILAAFFRLPVSLTRGLLLLLAIMMLVGAGLGVYHSGVEWGFWEGPASCSAGGASVTGSASDLLAQIGSEHGPSCTVAALRIMGLSMANMNVITSLVLAAIAFIGFRKAA
jgi:disulfide bond formation protein DsbB